MNSLPASTEKMQVVPNRLAHETMDERLRRLTREALSSGQQNAAGPAQAAGAAPHEGPEGVLHRIAHEAMIRRGR